MSNAIISLIIATTMLIYIMESYLSFDSYNLFLTFILALGTQLSFFFFAAIFKTDKFTDLAYGTSFALIAVLLLLVRKDFDITAIVLVLMIVLWGLRLSGYLFYRIIKIGKDKRFDGIREDLVKFAKFWLLQAVAIWLILIPSSIYLTSDVSEISVTNNLFNILGVLLWLIGLIIETVADAQKYNFKNDPENKDKWIQSGLWKYSRHPNYFGEVLIWWGMFIYVLPVIDGFLYLSVIGPVFITYLLLKVTGIPTIEKKYDERYKGNSEYKKYKETTSILIPLPKSS